MPQGRPRKIALSNSDRDSQETTFPRMSRIERIDNGKARNLGELQLPGCCCSPKEFLQLFIRSISEICGKMLPCASPPEQSLVDA
jgi:hypothetical protein